MAFILSKLLLFLLKPFLWVLALVAAGLLVKSRKLKKRIFITAAIVLLIFSNPFLITRVAAWWDYPRPGLNPQQHYSCAVVLGGFASEDGQGRGYFNGAADRFIQGLRLKATGQVSHILIASGNADLMPDKFREGDWVASELKVLHVPDSAVLIENQSRNTVENARNSKALLLQHHLPPPYVLVTSAFHMRRAMEVCRKEKLPVVPYACNFDGTPGKLSADDFIPSAGPLNGWTLYFKEFIGFWVLKMKS